MFESSSARWASARARAQRRQLRLVGPPHARARAHGDSHRSFAALRRTNERADARAIGPQSRDVRCDASFAQAKYFCEVTWRRTRRRRRRSVARARSFDSLAVRRPRTQVCARARAHEGEFANKTKKRATADAAAVEVVQRAAAGGSAFKNDVCARAGARAHPRYRRDCPFAVVCARALHFCAGITRWPSCRRRRRRRCRRCCSRRRRRRRRRHLAALARALARRSIEASSCARARARALLHIRGRRRRVHVLACRTPSHVRRMSARSLAHTATPAAVAHRHFAVSRGSRAHTQRLVGGVGRSCSFSVAVNAAAAAAIARVRRFQR